MEKVEKRKMGGDKHEEVKLVHDYIPTYLVNICSYKNNGKNCCLNLIILKLWRYISYLLTYLLTYLSVSGT